MNYQVDYYRKYLTYKKKYLQLKNYQFGGGDVFEHRGEQYQFYFFHAGTKPDEDFVEVLKNSAIFEEVEKFYIDYDGYRMHVTKNNEKYKVFSLSVRNYAIEKNRKSEINEIMKEINTLLDNQQIIIHKTISKEPIFSPGLPKDFNSKKEWWYAYLKHVNTNKVIGEYMGRMNLDRYTRLYNVYSVVEIEPKYQGRGLCTPFAEKTYRQLINTLNVQYINIHVAVEKDFSKYACQCYVGAALLCKLRCFIDGKEVFEKTTCGVFNNSMYVIFTNGIMIDDEMKQTSRTMF